jgi:phosphatidate cytidylyltransferase
VKRVLTAVVLILLVILVLFKAPLTLFTLLVLGVAVLAAGEYLRIAKSQGLRPFAVVGYLFLVLTFAVFYRLATLTAKTSLGANLGIDQGGIGMLFFLLALWVPLVLLVVSLRSEPLSTALPDAAVSYMMLPYIGFTLGLLPVLRAVWNGALFVLYLMLLVWCGDVAAFYVGRSIGTHKLAPRISPGKSWEGALASVLGAVVVAGLLFHFIGPIAGLLRGLHLLAPPAGYYHVPARFNRAPDWFIAAFAVAVNVAAQLGDLVESALKRGAGVKDSGTLLPGHGGVLDRIDGLLFALPVGLIFLVAGCGRYFVEVWQPATSVVR